MILAFVAMAVFLYWLSLQSQKQKAVEIREDSVAQAAAAADSASSAGATLVSPTDLQNSTAQYAGQSVKVTGLTVASQLGKQGFWLDLPSGSPFLVSLPDSLRAQGASAPTGQMATVIGTIKPMSDSVVNAWTAAGTITQADRAAASFAQFFLEATRVQTSAPGGAPSSGGAGGSGGS
jgi:hypothetical protein